MSKALDPPQRIATSAAPSSDLFSQAFRFGDLVWTSGIVPRDPATGAVPAGFSAQAELTLTSLEALLAAAGSSLRQALKVTAYLADIADRDEFNTIYRRFIDAGSPPARTAVQVAGLNAGYLIEIEAVAWTTGG